jgi:hypothetical protein
VIKKKGIKNNIIIIIIIIIIINLNQDRDKNINKKIIKNIIIEYKNIWL